MLKVLTLLQKSRFACMFVLSMLKSRQLLSISLKLNKYILGHPTATAIFEAMMQVLDPEDQNYKLYTT